MQGRLGEVWPVAAFTAAYLLPAAATALATGNFEFVFYTIVLVVLIGLVWFVDRFVGLSSGALWGLSAWGALHMAGGLVNIPASWPANAPAPAVLYNMWLIPDRLKFDQFVHAFGFGLTTWICWQALAAALRARDATPQPTAGLMVLCAAAGMGFGAMNEVIEFAATILVPETNVGGYMNTGWDLVANLVGVTIAAIWIGVRGHRETSA
ncbi:MAG: DUF2238 domain-containing protein [Acidobacteria bacterium]|nr:DUF2238 domain-containing protein [Acidobacteriota bacterium]